MKLQGGIMKKVFALVVLSLCMAAPSFASNVVGHVGHGAEAVGKDSAKVVTVAAKDTGKAGVRVVKFLF
jgi:hypothetical protein